MNESRATQPWVWVDLDDTLIDFRANSRRALEEIYAEAGLDRYFPTVEEWVEVYEKHNTRLWEQYSRAEVTKDYLRLHRMLDVLSEAVSGNVTEREEALARRLDVDYLDALARQKQLIPGAIELLESIRSQGCKVGVLSNGFSQVQHRKILAAGLEPYIDLVVLSDDIGVNKPDVRIYRHAMERAGEPDVEMHAMIGDNVATDVSGAVNAGWPLVLWFNPRRSDQTMGGRGYVRIYALDEAVGYVAQWLGHVML